MLLKNVSDAFSRCGVGGKKEKKKRKKETTPTHVSSKPSEGGGMGMVSKGREEPLLGLTFQAREGCGGGSWKIRPSYV